MSATQKLFTELFRPKTLDGLILTNRVRNELSKGLIQNTLLYGGPGSGKCLEYNEEIDIYVSKELYQDINNFFKNKK